MADSLYERLGGEAAVDAAVDLFYKKVLDDDGLKGFFDGVDMKRQAQHQKNFMTMAFGGPKSYSGRSMRLAHEKLVNEKGLNESHFNKVAGHLVATLQELGVAQELIDEVVAIVSTTKDDVLNK